ncbi:MAG: M42 family metallopeptidase [Bacilli bacterium]
MRERQQRMARFKALTEMDGVSGFERPVRTYMAQQIAPYVHDVTTDRLGSLIATKNGAPNGPRVAIVGHLDEIGMMVTRIDDRGFIYFQTIGGWWTQVMLAKRVTIHTKNGPISGIIGSKPPHVLPLEQRKKVVETKDMFIDIGVESRDEAVQAGVAPGDAIAPYFEFMPMVNPNFLCAKAWDNRIGCAVVMDVLEQLKDVSHASTVLGIATVQEEVGVRGAQTAANKTNPDMVIAVDVGIAGDTPGITPKEACGKLGGGPVVSLYDARLVSHVPLREWIVNVAEECGIPVQFDTTPGGGTDAGAMHIAHDGAPAITISIASRYIHSQASIIHQRDYEQTVQLLVEVLKRLDGEKYDKLVYQL